MVGGAADRFDDGGSCSSTLTTLSSAFSFPLPLSSGCSDQHWSGLCQDILLQPVHSHLARSGRGAEATLAVTEVVAAMLAATALASWVLMVVVRSRLLSSLMKASVSSVRWNFWARRRKETHSSNSGQRLAIVKGTA